MNLNKQHGMTLVELMVAAALGLVIVFFITNIMINSSRTALQSEGLSQAQENGRFILSWLQGNVRSAGLPYPSSSSQERIQPFAEQCTGTDLPPADNADCSFDSDSSNVSDRLAVQRTYINDTDIGNDATKRDCSGAEISVAGITDGDTVTDVYWVQTDPRDTSGYQNELVCVTYYNHVKVSDAQVIANGIDGMQVLYGVRASEDNQYRSNINRFVSLEDLGSDIDWSTIGAVRIAILTRSFNEQATSRNKRSYILLDAAPVTFEDSVARHIQSTTVFLPNE